MNDVEKRLALFAHIEPGTSFWGREISERGASATYDRLLGSGYDRVKYAQLIEKVTSFNAESFLKLLFFHSPKDLKN